MNIITIIILFAALLAATVLGNIVAYSYIKKADQAEQDAEFSKMAKEMLLNTQSVNNE